MFIPKIRLFLLVYWFVNLILEDIFRLVYWFVNLILDDKHGTKHLQGLIRP